jgi:MFS-type transporter involved in bile tolerance (Atg22 family)
MNSGSFACLALYVSVSFFAISFACIIPYLARSFYSNEMDRSEVLFILTVLIHSRFEGLEFVDDVPASQ